MSLVFSGHSCGPMVSKYPQFLQWNFFVGAILQGCALEIYHGLAAVADVALLSKIQYIHQKFSRPLCHVARGHINL